MKTFIVFSYLYSYIISPLLLLSIPICFYYNLNPSFLLTLYENSHPKDTIQ